jgi:Flp pilus assembly protein TadG
VTLRERLRYLARRAVGSGRDDGGALTLSYVVVLPVIFLFLMSAIQASFWFLARDAALAAARQGADAARAVGASMASGESTALSFARQAGSGYLMNPAATVRHSNATTVAVTVSGRVPSFVPGLTVRVSETVQAPVEEFRP